MGLNGSWPHRRAFACWQPLPALQRVRGHRLFRKSPFLKHPETGGGPDSTVYLKSTRKMGRIKPTYVLSEKKWTVYSPLYLTQILFRIHQHPLRIHWSWKCFESFWDSLWKAVLSVFILYSCSDWMKETDLKNEDVFVKTQLLEVSLKGVFMS